MPQLTEAWRLGPLLVLPAALGAQIPGFELRVGRWYNGNAAQLYQLRTSTRLGGPFTQGLGIDVAVNDSLGRHRAFYGAGYELQAGRGRSSFGPYAAAGLELGLSSDTSTQELAALWSVGGGIEWRPFSWIALGTELRYRLEDRGPRGFWRAGPDRRDGLGATAGIVIALGHRRGRGLPAGGQGAYPNEPPPPAPGPTVAVPPPGAAGTEARLAVDVVQTAIESLGTPYVWGGTLDNGFDCSGLIQYAYAEHGIRIPRTSRDQAHAGGVVTPVVEALRPGDILLFAAQPGGGVSHVGMYVGELKFIHSSNQGVKLSRLDPEDPEGAYWIERWVGARRIIP